MAEIPSPGDKSKKDGFKDALDEFDIVESQTPSMAGKENKNNNSSDGISDHQMTGRSQVPLITDLNIVESQFEEMLVKNVIHPKNEPLRQEFKVSKAAQDLGLRNINSFDDDDEEDDQDSYQIREVENYVDARYLAMNGSFKPIILLISENHLHPDMLVDQESGYRIIHLIAHFGKIKALQTLVGRLQADVNIPDGNGQTAIHLSALSGQIQILRYLASLAKRNSSLNSPLELEVRDKLGATPLLNAVKGSQIVAFLFLLYSKSADLNTADGSGNTALHIASFNNSKSFLELLLVHTKVDINALDNSSVTPLMRAIYSSAYDAVKVLLRFKPDITIPNDKGVAPKEYAKRYFKENDGIYSKILPAIEKHEIQEVVDQIESFETFKEQYRCNWIFWSLFMKRFLHGKKAALIQYISFMLFAWIYGQFVLQMHIFDSLLMTIAFHLFLGASVISFIVFIYSSKKFQGSLESTRTSIYQRTPQNIVYHILQLVDDGKLSQIPTEDRVCFICLSMKQQHSEHCKRCKRCVKRFHKHSQWLDACVGSHNARSYYLFLVFNFLTFSFLLSSFFFTPLPKSATPVTRSFLAGTVQKFMELTIYKGYGINLVIYGIFVSLFFVSGQELLWMNEAVMNDVTVRELKKMWLYKYNYDIEIDEKSEQTFFAPRRMHVCSSICNVLRFCRGENKARTSWNSPRDPQSARNPRGAQKKVQLEEEPGEQGISESPMFVGSRLYGRDAIHDMTYEMDMEERTGTARLELSGKTKVKHDETPARYFELSSNIDTL